MLRDIKQHYLCRNLKNQKEPRVSFIHYPDVISLFFSYFKILNYCYFICKKTVPAGLRRYILYFHEMMYLVIWVWASLGHPAGFHVGSLCSYLHYVPHFRVLNFESVLHTFFFPVVSGLRFSWNLHCLIQNLSLQGLSSCVARAPGTQAQRLCIRQLLHGIWDLSSRACKG